MWHRPLEWHSRWPRLRYVLTAQSYLRAIRRDETNLGRVAFSILSCLNQPRIRPKWLYIRANETKDGKASTAGDTGKLLAPGQDDGEKVNDKEYESIADLQAKFHLPKLWTIFSSVKDNTLVSPDVLLRTLPAHFPYSSVSTTTFRKNKTLHAEMTFTIGSSQPIVAKCQTIFRKDPLQEYTLKLLVFKMISNGLLPDPRVEFEASTLPNPLDNHVSLLQDHIRDKSSQWFDLIYGDFFGSYHTLPCITLKPVAALSPFLPSDFIFSIACSDFEIEVHRLVRHDEDAGQILMSVIEEFNRNVQPRMDQSVGKPKLQNSSNMALGTDALNTESHRIFALARALERPAPKILERTSSIVLQHHGKSMICLLHSAQIFVDNNPFTEEMAWFDPDVARALVLRSAELKLQRELGSMNLLQEPIAPSTTSDSAQNFLGNYVGLSWAQMLDTVSKHLANHKSEQSSTVVSSEMGALTTNTSIVSDNQQQSQGQEDESRIQSYNVDSNADSTTAGLAAYDIALDGRLFPSMIQTLKDARAYGLPDNVSMAAAKSQDLSQISLSGKYPKPSKSESQNLLRAQNAKFQDPRYRPLMEQREKLPIMAQHIQDKILTLFKRNDVTVIISSTGSGKTTQVPQIILDQEIRSGHGSGYRIICTQPRRLAASSIARRVAYERNEPLQDSVGYRVRFNALPPSKSAHILYCTTAVLLRGLQQSPDEIMNKYGALIIDEVHERSMPVDLVLVLIRDLIRERKRTGKRSPKILLMSATIDNSFVDYFSETSANVPTLRVASLEVEGRAHPVQAHYLNDILPLLVTQFSADEVMLTPFGGSRADRSDRLYLLNELCFAADPNFRHQNIPHQINSLAPLRRLSQFEVESLIPIGLVVATIVHVARTTNDGDILVFLPGLGEIDKVAKALEEKILLNTSDPTQPSFLIFKLHSALQTTNDTVFAPVRAGVRRVVLSTNIAETSLTLPEVVYVIDTGKSRVSRYLPEEGVNMLGCQWTSKTGSLQRRGRAGRVRPGHYYALFTSERYDSFAQFSDPEMQRLDLVKTAVDIKSQANPANVHQVFQRMIDPPDPLKVKATMNLLQDIGAITASEELTPLGRMLSAFPLHPTESMAVLLGILFRCLEPMLIIACHEMETPLITSPFYRSAAAQSQLSFSGTTGSDLLGIVNGFREYNDAMGKGDTVRLAELESERFIRPNVYHEMLLIARQIWHILKNAGILPTVENLGNVFHAIPEELNVNSENIALVKALTLATIDSKIAVWGGKQLAWRTAEVSKALMSPRSVNNARSWGKSSPSRKKYAQGDMVAYLQKTQAPEDKHPFLQGTTLLTPAMLLLFAQDIKLVNTTTSEVLVNNWLRANFKIGNVLLDLNQDQLPNVALEFRKAVQRFLTLAFSQLRDGTPSPSGSPHVNHKPNSLFTEDSPLRRTMVQGIIDVLNLDRQALMEEMESKNEEEGDDNSADETDKPEEREKQPKASDRPIELSEETRHSSEIVNPT